MLLLVLAVLLVAFYPFSSGHFFSPSHIDPLFMISHASWSHLLLNVLSLLLVWLMAHRSGESEKKLLLVFFLCSVVSLFIPVLFSQPVIGASAGIYGMIGYLLPDLAMIVPMPFSYALFFLIILSEGCFTCNAWTKLFHTFGLTLGIVLRYMLDFSGIGLRENARKLGLGVDYYSLLALGYPHGYVHYLLPKLSKSKKK